MSTNKLGRYHIIRELARSNDIVYEAMDPSQGKKIALKELLMPANLVGQARQERIQRFTREARAAAGLKHTNIVRILEHGQDGPRYFIAMEFLQGQSLRDVLRQRGAMPFSEALRIASAVADGLEYAHKHGVIHRDVKPDNVHLEPDGRVVITDFGIARLTFEPTLTADGQIFGTPSYMSPEQVAGKGIDKRTDVFSLGVMLYEMVAGRKPFTGDSVITITYNIMNAEPGPIPGASPGLEQVIRAALAKDPAHRYAGASQLAEDLRCLAAGQPPRHASRMSPPRPAPPPQGGAWNVPPPGSSRGSSPGGYSAPPAAGRPSSPPAPAFPSPGPPPAAPPRSMPQPVFGPPRSQPAGYPAPPLPGARPMPARGGRPGPMPGLPPVGPAPGTAGSAPMPGPYPSVLAQRQAQARARSSNTAWLAGWLLIAAVIAGIILSVVWAGVTAYDKVRQNSAATVSASTQEAADRAFQKGQYDQALRGYLQVAQGGPQAYRETAARSAAVAATELAKQRLEKRDGPAAESLSRQALDLNQDYAPAYISLARALAQQDRVDEALPVFDQAVSAAQRTAQSGASRAEKASSRAAGESAGLWKAQALYEDGVRLLGSNALLAQQRFTEVIKVAPRSDFARAARQQLQRMASVTDGDGGGVAAPAGDLPPAPSMGGSSGGGALPLPASGLPLRSGGPSGGGGPVGGPGRGGRNSGWNGQGPPPGWNPNYNFYNR